MKICRYQESVDGPVRIGLVEHDMVRDVSRIADELPSLRWPVPPGDLMNFELKVNGESRQKDTVGNLALSVVDLIEHAASIMALYPDDVIFSGTPPMSVGPVIPGDVMHAQLDGVGEMSVTVYGGPGRKTPA